MNIAFEYQDIKKFRRLSFEWKYALSYDFYYDLNNFNILKPQKEDTEEKKLMCMKEGQNDIMSC